MIMRRFSLFEIIIVIKNVKMLLELNEELTKETLNKSS